MFANKSIRSNDGLTLIMTSSDGFCSTLAFSPGELGELYTGRVPTADNPTPAPMMASARSTPAPSPSLTEAPTFTSRPSSHAKQLSPEPGLIVAAKPISPTRSNSTSSIATQSSYATPAPGTVISNPTIVTGVLPSIAATNSGAVTGFTMATPPQTPHSAASSVSGVKRDAAGASESEDGGQEKKKRRIAPTPVPEPSGNP